MQVNLEPRTYPQDTSAAFKRSKDQYGKLSNMTGGFSLTVNGLTFQSPEGLYQALKFPSNPQFQKNIGTQSSGMSAKTAAYDRNNKPMQGWDSIRVQAMVYTTAVKLAQHPRIFTEALMETGTLHIVENSSRDSFWGAAPRSGTYQGVNVLGKILTLTRDTLTQSGGNVPHTIEKLMADLPANTLVVNAKHVTIPEMLENSS